MKMLVASIYVEILNLLNEAIVYYRSNHLRQLRDAVLRPVETKFDQCIERISAEVDKLHELKDAAHVAQQADMKDLLESTGHVVGRLHENLTHSLMAFSSRISLLETRLETMAHQSSAIHAFHATTHALALADILLPAAPTAQEQLALVRTQRFALSLKDHWYENGVIDAFTTWSRHGQSELLWIGGRAGNQDTWVTEMSIDLVDALRLQDLTLLHSFCDENTTPSPLMKILVAQLLDNHPDIPFSEPANYNARRFRRATTFARLWTIFEALVNEVTRSVFVLIDRIED
ncbi:hypothetical protein EJ07DRAFT_185191 [Lizonia empirigonia]|nr:hypothetical protein EJ07DRAFT_185191 [Lizonia empirigonia]